MMRPPSEASEITTLGPGKPRPAPPLPLHHPAILEHAVGEQAASTSASRNPPVHARNKFTDRRADERSDHDVDA